MKKGLIICCTPYQVMIGAVLREQNFCAADSVDLIITDTFENYEVLGERIKKTKVYAQVYFAHVKSVIYAKEMQDGIKKLIYFADYIRGTCSLINTRKLDYDEIYYNCNDIFSYNLISAVRNTNEKAQVFRYEEGYSTYIAKASSSLKAQKAVMLRNSVISKLVKHSITVLINGLFVFEPQLMLFESDCPVYTINREIAESDEYIRFITEIFQTQKAKDLYRRKYIIFEESFSEDGFDVDDLEIYKKIISEVGSENVSVKLHPRSQKNRFAEWKVDVHKSEGVPWEAILLSKRFSNTVFIALGSGSVINSRLLSGDSTQAILVYKCLKKRPPALDGSFSAFLDKFKEKYSYGLCIPENIGELLNNLNGRKSWTEKH